MVLEHVQALVDEVNVASPCAPEHDESGAVGGDEQWIWVHEHHSRDLGMVPLQLCDKLEVLPGNRCEVPRTATHSYTQLHTASHISCTHQEAPQVNGRIRSARNNQRQVT